MRGRSKDGDKGPCRVSDRSDVLLQDAFFLHQKSSIIIPYIKYPDYILEFVHTCRYIIYAKSGINREKHYGFSLRGRDLSQPDNQIVVIGSMLSLRGRQFSVIVQNRVNADSGQQYRIQYSMR